MSTVAGGTIEADYRDGLGTYACFFNPGNITTDGEYLYLTDINNHCIRRIDIATTMVTTLAGGSYGSIDGIGTAAKFMHPNGITGDSRYLYISEPEVDRIRRIEIATRTVETISSPGDFDIPNGLATDGLYLYVAEGGNGGTIKRMSLATMQVETLSTEFINPVNLLLNGTNLYIVDRLGHVIKKMDLYTKEVSVVGGSTSNSGSRDGIGGDARFNQPGGITTDGIFLYITDMGNNMIRRIE